MAEKAGMVIVEIAVHAESDEESVCAEIANNPRVLSVTRMDVVPPRVIRSVFV